MKTRVVFRREHVLAISLDSTGIQAIKTKNKNFFRRVEYAFKRWKRGKPTTNETKCGICGKIKTRHDCPYQPVGWDTAEVIVLELRRKLGRKERPSIIPPRK